MSGRTLMSHSTHQPQFDGGQQPYGQPPQHGYQAPAPRPMRNGLGTAALVLGIIGVITAAIPLLFWLGGTLGLIGLILGMSGRGRVKRGEANNKGVTTVGAVLGLLAMVLGTIAAVVTFKAVDDAVDELDQATSASREPASGSDGKNKGKDKGKSDDSSLAAGESAVYKNGVKVTVSKATSYSPTEYAVGHTEGNKAYQVSVTVENTGDEKFDSTLVTADARAGEDGVTAEQIFDEKTGSGFDGTVLPGKKATVIHAFDAPADAKTLTVEVSPDILLDASVWELTV
ncbi:DUF4352 domain-containing protein [Streptomyces katsurahamanus]|uniref:DUF4352 domain-containing protein n=2 Tax=Streptomyces katsurahamanus TaxID=2577098 RepID=A0ABW9NVN9_9ACTN|nr:DUF4352 domain-containing protein [Streptomyces katsurahamanus]